MTPERGGESGGPVMEKMKGGDGTSEMRHLKVPQVGEEYRGKGVLL